MKRNLLGGLCLAALGLPALAQDYPRMNLSYNAVLGETAYLSELDRHFAEQIHERSGGAITLDIQWAGALGGQDEVLLLGGSGAVDFVGAVLGYYFAEFPFAGLTNSVPAVFSSENVLDITVDAFAHNPEIVAEFERLNLHPVLFRHLPEYRLICTRPVASVADLAGLRIRTYGPYIPAMFEAFGAVPVNISFGEIYEGLQRGTVDCAFWTRALMANARLHEVAHYLVDLPLGAINGYTMLTSLETWQSWPEATRALIEEVAEETRAMSVPVTEAAEAAAMETMLAAGVEVVPFTDPEAFYAGIPDMLGIWQQLVAGQFPERAEAAAAFAADLRARVGAP